MGSKCGEAWDWTGGELEEAEQPLPTSSRWTHDQSTSNVGRQTIARPTLDASIGRVQRWTLPVPASNTLRWHKLQMGLGLGLEVL